MPQVAVTSPGLEIPRSEERSRLLGIIPENTARTYLDIAGTVIVALNPDESVAYINKKGCEILGYPEDNIVGRNWFDVFLPDRDCERTRQTFHKILTGKMNLAAAYENPVLTREGDERVIAWTNTLLRDGDGKITGTLSSGQDITERMQMESALRESEERYRMLFDSNPYPMWVYDLDTLQILDVNQAAVEHYGYSRQEFLQLTIKDIRPPEDVPALLENVHQVTRGMDRAGVWRHIKKDGTMIFVEITSHTIDFKGHRAEVVLAYDLTRRKQAEMELRRSEEKYRSFFEDDLTGDYISDLEGKILFCNPAFLKIFGFTSLEQALKYNVLSLYTDAQAREKLLRDLRHKRRLENYEMELQKLDGTPLYVMTNIIGIFDEQGELCNMKGYLYDITQHKRTEEQFWLAQKMEAIGRLAGGVAHDFNNLLSVINGYSELALHRIPKKDALHKDLSMIFEAGRKAEALTRQLLAFSRRQMMQPRVLNLNDLVDDLQKMLRRLIGEDIKLVVKKESGLGNVKADPTQLEQVLLNLAVNSRDAMPQGGKLIIETSNLALSADTVQEKVTMPAGSYVLLVVTDTGVGMDARTRASLFEPFFTTKEKGKGTGLGLSTVYGIVKQSGGYIWVYSEPGKGTTFKIYLPMVEGNLEEHLASSVAPETLRGRRNGAAGGRRCRGAQRFGNDPLPVWIPGFDVRQWGAGFEGTGKTPAGYPADDHRCGDAGNEREGTGGQDNPPQERHENPVSFRLHR